MKKPGKRIKSSYRFKDVFLKVFLVISIAFSIFIVSNCDFLTNFIDDLNGGGNPPPEFGGSESGSYVTTLFKSVAEGAAGEIGGSTISWAMSALGLSDGSHDYTDQLNKIDQDLQEIIGQLDNIQSELINIDNDLKNINCSDWASSLKDEKSRVTSLLTDYHTYVATASNNELVKDSVINDWVDQVLAIGYYSSKKSMADILSAFSTQLIAGANSGVIPACIQAITPLPSENSFGTDTLYYNKVMLYINYYYSYQVQALFLYNEARHYQAWKAAGSPNSDYLSADSVSYVCSNQNAALYCNEAAGRTNNLYNALISQFTAAGAPYTNENLILMYNQDNPYLWPKSLEDFTIAAGDNCADPLTSAIPCGVTANFYDESSVGNVVFKGYTGWLKAGTTLLTNLLAGWTSGTAGYYLQNNLGFKNMNNKIIMSQDAKYVKFTPSDQNINVQIVPFFDTDINYSLFQGVIKTDAQFQSLSVYDNSTGRHCSTGYLAYYNNWWRSPTNLPSSRNNFYSISAAQNGYVNYAGVLKWCEDFHWLTFPGWYTGNKTSSAVQYQWPVLPLSQLSCTDGRSNLNTAGVWTKCGDDFTAWLEYNVPRPETCDDSGAGVSCIVTGEAVANAKSVFGNNSKGQRRF